MERPHEGIATDASHSMKYGVTRFRGVDLKDGRELFSHDIGNQTVNIGEFLGVVEAVKYLIANDYRPRIIYTDSITAISWFTHKHAASKKRFAQILKAEVFLKAFSAEVDTIEVIHWDNVKWGETPADFDLK